MPTVHYHVEIDRVGRRDEVQVFVEDHHHTYVGDYPSKENQKQQCPGHIVSPRGYLNEEEGYMNICGYYSTNFYRELFSI